MACAELLTRHTRLAPVHLRCHVLHVPATTWCRQRTRPCRHYQRETFLAKAANQSTLASSILSVLKDEQKYAASSYRKDEELLDDPPNEFEVDNPPGKRVVYLLKEHKDEQLIVEMDIEQQIDAAEESLEGEGEDPDEDQDELPPVSFSVQVIKSSGVLAFQCVSDGEYVSIKELVLESESRRSKSPASGSEGEEDAEDDDSDSVYTGPPFEQLDDTLQQAFLDFLEERGVTAELGRYLQRLLADKAATEYQAWLQRVRNFIDR